jgi:hypothetical protein
VGVLRPRSEVKKPPGGAAPRVASPSWALLKHDIKTFLNDLDLELSIEKTLITNARNSTSRFLGVHIKRQSQNSGHARLTKNSRGVTRRSPTGNLWMTMPTKDIISRLESKGFLKRRNQEIIPQSITRFLILPIKEMIIRFRVILNGFLNYFSFIDNPHGLLKIY